MMAVPDLSTIRERVVTHAPDLVPRQEEVWAATALVLAPDDDGPVIAFMERTRRAGDRWSGHMALPGGRRDPGDPDLAVTAAREAREEVGLDLHEPPVGRLDDTRGRTTGLAIATFVFQLDDQPVLVPDGREAQHALWIPLARLLEPSAAIRHRHKLLWGFPAIRHGEHVIWGLTHRILGSFTDLLDLELPAPRRRR